MDKSAAHVHEYAGDDGMLCVKCGESRCEGFAASGLAVLTQAVTDHEPEGVWAMFSGGHDSLASTIIAAKHPAFRGVLHIDTGIGIDATREFVRATCAEHGWPLTELRTPHVYEDLVLDRGGFPFGPQSHGSFFFYLKRVPLNAWKREQPGVVVLVTGIRRKESTRRSRSPISVPVRKDGRKIWVSPILDWTAGECARLIDGQGFKRNQVVDLLHRSGECLCGALARSGEIHEIDAWYPEVGERIHKLERACADRGLAACIWASSEARGLSDDQTALFDKVELLPLCSSCEARYEEAADAA